MKKIALIILSFLITFNISYSQKKSKHSGFKEKFFLGLTAGPSIPSSDFANKKYSQSSGYANVGYKIQGYAGLNLFGTIGLSILGFMNSNSVDANALKTFVSNTYSGNEWTLNSQSWQLYGALGGISFYYPIGKDVFFDFKIMTGLLSSKSPELLFQSGNNTYKLESATANSFSYMTSLGLNFYTGHNISITGGVDFMRSDPNFTDVKTSINIHGNSSVTTTSFYREMDIININLGIRYSFR